MKIQTSRFGEIKIEDNKIITMPGGMIGFGEKKRFAIVQHKENSPFFWYQSVDDPSLAFVMTNPNFFINKYKVDPALVKRETGWQIKDNGKAFIKFYVTVRIPPNHPEQMTANLIGPVVINTKTMDAVQLVIPKSQYSHRHKILMPKSD